MKRAIFSNRTVQQRLRLASHVLQQDVAKVCQSKRPFQSTAECFVATLAAEVTVGRFYVERHGEPAFVFGSSFGHYSALVMAGAFSYLEALQLVKNFGAAIDRHFSNHRTYLTGGLAPEQVRQIIPALEPTAMLTNYSDGFALTIPEVAAARCQQLISGSGGFWRRIPLRLPYHSPVMRQIEPIAARVFAGLKLSSLRLPLLSAFYADFIDQPAAISYLLQKLEGRPNQIDECFDHLAQQGVEQVVHMKTSTFSGHTDAYQVLASAKDQ